MPVLTLMPGGEALGAQSQYTPDCPSWILVIVHDQEITIESWCGRYFEWLDNHGDDIAELLNDADCSELANGLYVIEGRVVTHSPTENESHETEWNFERIRAFTPQEWKRYREGAEIWDPAHFNPAFDETASELQELVEASKGWLAWRRNMEIDLSHVEVRLVAAIQTLMDEGDECSTAIPE